MLLKDGVGFGIVVLFSIHINFRMDMKSRIALQNIESSSEMTLQILGEERRYSRYYQRDQIDLFYILSQILHSVAFIEKPTDHEGNLLFSKPRKNHGKTLLTNIHLRKGALTEPFQYEYAMIYRLVSEKKERKAKHFQLGYFVISLEAETIEKAKRATVEVWDVLTFRAEETEKSFPERTDRFPIVNGNACFSYLINKFRIWLHVPRNVRKYKYISNEYKKCKKEYKEELKWKMDRFSVFAMLLESRFHGRMMPVGMVDVVTNDDLMKMIRAQLSGLKYERAMVLG